MDAVALESGTACKPLHIPVCRADLNETSKCVLSAGSDLEADHPGFTDPAYLARRKQYCDTALAYCWPDELPLFEYKQAEVDVWRQIFERISALVPTHTAMAYQRCFKDLCFSGEALPQLRLVSSWLSKRTGFVLMPTAGLLSSRNFLISLAFRVFQSTPYLRHGAQPFYTPEPDIVHEIIGHVPMLGDPLFALFSQEVGLACLGLSEADVTRLARVYWFTIEYGVILEEGKYRAIGAGILSSYGELERVYDGVPELLRFDPFDAAERDYPITSYQPVLYYVESFDELLTKFRAFVSSLTPVASVDYDAIRAEFATWYEQADPDRVHRFEFGTSAGA